MPKGWLGTKIYVYSEWNGGMNNDNTDNGDWMPDDT